MEHLVTKMGHLTLLMLILRTSTVALQKPPLLVPCVQHASSVTGVSTSDAALVQGRHGCDDPQEHSSGREALF